MVKALLEVDGFSNRFLIIINHFNHFAKQKWQLIFAIFAYYNCYNHPFCLL